MNINIVTFSKTNLILNLFNQLPNKCCCKHQEIHYCHDYQTMTKSLTRFIIEKILPVTQVGCYHFQKKFSKILENFVKNPYQVLNPGAEMATRRLPVATFLFPTSITIEASRNWYDRPNSWATKVKMEDKQLEWQKLLFHLGNDKSSDLLPRVRYWNFISCKITKKL